MPGFFSIEAKEHPTGSMWTIALGGVPRPDGKNTYMLARVLLSNQAFPDALIAINPLAGRLVERLDAIDSQLETEGELQGCYPRSEMWMAFSDSTLMTDQGNQAFLQLTLNDLYDLNSIETITISAALYKAVYLYLISEDRYIAYEGWLASVYAAWQWYNLSKYLSIKFETAKKLYTEEKFPDLPDASQIKIESKLKVYQESILEEMATAYRFLVQLIEDPRYASAIRWLAKWSGVGSKVYLSGPLLREQLRLSLPLWQYGSQAGVPIQRPVPGPGCLANSKPIWERTSLHPAFQSPAGAIAVHQLITKWLLPRYDFHNAIRLTILLRSRSYNKLRAVTAQSLVGLTFGALVVMMLFGSEIIRTQGGTGASTSWFFAIITLELIIGFIFPLILAINLLDKNILAHLMLPRVIGGVFIGYFGLMLESNSVSISTTLWSRGILIPSVLWVIVLAVGFVYLYYDTMPLVRHCKTASKRALTGLFVTLVIAFIVGLPITAVILANNGPSSYDGFLHGLLLGPFGWIDIPQFFVFMPIAMFTGLVTQFIFEELTLPASVWSPFEE